MSCKWPFAPLWCAPKLEGESPVSEFRHEEQLVAAPQRPLRRIDLRTLLNGEREAIILHEGQEYRLRITANAKLILTK